MIVLNNITKKVVTNNEEKVIIDNLSLTVENNSIIGIYGKSALGKTTLLNIIAGIDKKYEGKIEGADSVSYSFQDDRLIKWFNVRDNLKKIVKNENKINEWVDKLKINDLLDKKISNLSGGEKRRVSLTRTFAFDSKLVLLDEPFNGIDEKTKNEIIEIIKDYAKKNKITIIFVSHDIDEHTKLCDKIYYFEEKMKINKIASNN